MATFGFHQDELKTCPYNRVHKVAARRYQQHVEECGKKAEMYLKQCPFNQVHRVKPSEFKRHCASCPDNRAAIREMHESAELRQQKQREEAQNSNRDLSSNPEVEEEIDLWEEDARRRSAVNSDGYTVPGLKSGKEVNPEEDFEKPLTMIQLQKLAKADRKKYYDRQNEIHRKRNAKLNAEADSALGSSRAASETMSVSDTSSIPTDDHFDWGTPATKPTQTSTTAKMTDPNESGLQSQRFGGIGRGIGRAKPN